MSQQGLWARGWALLPLPACKPGKQHLAAAIWGHVLVCCLQLASIGVVNEEPARRALREMLFTAPGVENYISGVVRKYESWSCPFFGHLGQLWDPVACATGLPCMRCQHGGAACNQQRWCESPCEACCCSLCCAREAAARLRPVLINRQWHCFQFSRAAVPAEYASALLCWTPVG